MCTARIGHSGRWTPLQRAQRCSGWCGCSRPLFPERVQRHSFQGALLSIKSPVQICDLILKALLAHSLVRSAASRHLQSRIASPWLCVRGPLSRKPLPHCRQRCHSMIYFTQHTCENTHLRGCLPCFSPYLHPAQQKCK